jgi:hypothetical protein
MGVVIIIIVIIIIEHPSGIQGGVNEMIHDNILVECRYHDSFIIIIYFTIGTEMSTACAGEM